MVYCFLMFYIDYTTKLQKVFDRQYFLSLLFSFSNLSKNASFIFCAAISCETDSKPYNVSVSLPYSRSYAR